MHGDEWEAAVISLLIHAILGVATTTWVLRKNRHLFARGWNSARPTLVEWTFWTVATASVILGWYFNIRYQYWAHAPSWPDYISKLFTNWAADSASQDYIFANVVLFPLWIIMDGRRQGIRVPWGFFVMSLFTSFGFAMGAYLAVVERQVRYTRDHAAVQVPVA